MAWNSRYSYINMDNPNNSDGSIAKGYPIFRSSSPMDLDVVIGRTYRTSLVMNDNVVATNSGTIQNNWVDNNIDGQRRHTFSSNKL